MPVLLLIGGILAALLFLAKKAEGEVAYIDFAGDSPWSDTPRSKVESIDTMIAYAATKYRVEAALVKAVAMTESSLNPNAQNPSDPSYGLMQIMPILAEDFGIVKEWQNPTSAEIAMILDPQTNLRIGAWHLSRLLAKYTLDTSIEMYNVGETGWKNGRRNPGYVAKVKGYYDEFRNHSIG